jgi:diacylglycerol kinase (ATP)
MKAQSQFAARAKSFGYAFQGIATLLRSQLNARIHALAMVIVVLAAWYWQVSALQWCVLVLTIAMVLSAEAVNTALEILCDKVEPEQHAAIKQVKDVAAAAVLLVAIAAAIIGLIIFLPLISA